MDMKHLVAGLVGLIGVAASASAAVVTEDKGPYSVTYDNATVFGKISFWYSQGANAVGFGWDVPGAVSLVSTHSAQTSIDIPSFTITANPGYSLSGPLSSFLGNLVFNELGTTTSASGSGKVSADGGPAVPVGGDLLKTVTLTGLDGFAGGYFSGSSTASFGSFVTLAVSDAMITLSIDGQGFGSIVAQPQNQLKFGFFATAVPVPPAVWLLGSALGALGTIMRRRRT